eukprot:5089181-Prorocentrum_lima.AAC.1
MGAQHVPSRDKSPPAHALVIQERPRSVCSKASLNAQGGAAPSPLHLALGAQDSAALVSTPVPRQH